VQRIIERSPACCVRQRDRVSSPVPGYAAGAGWEFVHVYIDDASRLAYSEGAVRRAQRERGTVSRTRARLVRWPRGQRPAGDGRQRLGLPQPSLARGLSTAGLRHIRTKPYTPLTKGKAERFIQTGLREWAYAQAYASSQARRDALADWLGHYNTHHPGQPTAGQAARPDPAPWYDRRDRSFLPTWLIRRPQWRAGATIAEGDPPGR
jgi:transposase InsO family protein